METPSRLHFQRIRCKVGKKLIDARKEIMETYGYISKTEFRRHKLPYYICTLKDLEDTKFMKSFEMLFELLVDNEDAEAKDSSGFVKKLKESNFVMDVLKEILVNAETAECDKDPVKQCKILSAGAHRILDIALGHVPVSGVSHFDGKGWFWLVLRLLEIALDTAENIKIDGGEREAVQRYLLAKLLLEIFPEDRPARAEGLLKIARFMTLGMDHWKLDGDEGDNEITLNSVIVRLMADMYMNMGAILINVNLNEALEVCGKAVKRAQEANDPLKVGEALIKRGCCHMKMKNYQLALDDFTCVMCLEKKNNHVQGICEANVTLSLVYQELKNIKNARAHLTDIIDIAKEHNLRDWEGMAHWKLGELLMKESCFEESVENYWKAFAIFGNIACRMEEKMRSRPSIDFSLAEYFTRRPTRNTRLLSRALSRKSSLRLHIFDIIRNIMETRAPVGFLLIPGPSKPPTKLQSSAYRTAAMEGLSSSMSNMTLASTPRSVSRKVSGKKALEPYYLDDIHGRDDLGMSTYIDMKNKNEVSLIRCQYGVSKAHQYLKIFLEEVEKCQYSQKARNRIISWKLNMKPFWENRDEPEEIVEPERVIYPSLASSDFIWEPMELISVHSSDD